MLFMVKDYLEALSCINSVINQTNISRNAIDAFSQSYLVINADPNPSDSPRRLLKRAWIFNDDITASIIKMKNWSQTDAPDIDNYVKAKFFSRRKGYCGLGYLLSIGKSREAKERAKEDYSFYQNDVDSYNIKSNFTESSMKQLSAQVDSYMHSVCDIAIKFESYYLQNSIDSDFNIIMDTWIEMKYFKENVRDIMKVISREKTKNKPFLYMRLESILHKKERIDASYSNS
jgi:hypothetical protein